MYHEHGVGWTHSKPSGLDLLTKSKLTKTRLGLALKCKLLEVQGLDTLDPYHGLGSNCKELFPQQPQLISKCPKEQH
jgi:hypothetical protein